METPFDVASPCIGVCRIRSDGLCDGCLRSRGEIAAWPGLDREGRLALLEDLGRRGERETRKRA